MKSPPLGWCASPLISASRSSVESSSFVPVPNFLKCVHYSPNSPNTVGLFIAVFFEVAVQNTLRCAECLRVFYEHSFGEGLTLFSGVFCKAKS